MVKSLGPGWKQGVGRDLNPIGGWKTLGLTLPSLSLEVARLGRSGAGHLLLHLGLPPHPGQLYYVLN